jgi:hypothetical protein
VGGEPGFGNGSACTGDAVDTTDALGGGGMGTIVCPSSDAAAANNSRSPTVPARITVPFPERRQKRFVVFVQIKWPDAGC